MRALAGCGQLPAWSSATRSRPGAPPAIDLRGALTTPKVNHRAAITDPTELAIQCEAD
jgi:hypothetical protein